MTSEQLTSSRSSIRCFCIGFSLWLELRDQSQLVRPVFEAALFSLSDTKHLQIIWKRYNFKASSFSNVHFISRYRYLLHECQKLRRISKKSKGPLTSFPAFSTLVKRSLQSVACKVPVPHSRCFGMVSDAHWLDYTFHCEVVEFYCACLSEGDRSRALHAFVRMMPQNVMLVMRYTDCRDVTPTSITSIFYV